MQKILISLPDELTARLRATIPARQRSKVITHLIEDEVERRERMLYECAVAVENDKDLQNEMKDWNVTIADGLNEDLSPAKSSKKKK